MEYIPYMGQTDPVPGLGRGLAILDHLGREGACSLERIARDLKLPKSSTSRLLESLGLVGCVVRDPVSKRYRAVRVLVSLPAPGTDLRQVAGPEAAALATATAASVEVYAWTGGNLVMVDRADPEEGTVVVWARVGWVRPSEELDSLNRIACAHGGQACTPKWILVDGERRVLDAGEVAAAVDRARGEEVVRDPGPNGRGVVRVSAPILAGDRLVGVLALAGTVFPDAEAERALAAAATAISRRIQPHPISQGQPA